MDGADYIFTNPRTGGTIRVRHEDADSVPAIGAYVKSTTCVTPKFDLIGALRVDRNDRITGSPFSPRVALAYKPAANHNLRVTYSRRSCDGGASGGLCMRPPRVASGAFVPATASSAFGSCIQARSAAFVTGVRQAGLSAAQAQPIVGYPGTRRPTAADIPTRIASPTDAGTVNRAPAQFQDIRPLTASYNTNYEVGYTGILGAGFGSRSMAGISGAGRGHAVQPPAPPA